MNVPAASHSNGSVLTHSDLVQDVIIMAVQCGRISTIHTFFDLGCMSMQYLKFGFFCLYSVKKHILKQSVKTSPSFFS